MKRIGSVLLLLSASLALPIAVQPAQAATELIVNGTFGSDTANWWSTGNAPISVDAGRLKAVVPGGTANRWDAMLGQKTPAIPLQSGRAYTLSFDASATATRTVRTTVQVNAAPYPATLDQTFTVDTTARRYTFPFTGTLDTAIGEVTLQLGAQAGYTVYFDNISLSAADPPSTPSPSPSPSPPASGSPIDMTSGFYVDPDSNPAIWVRNNGGDGRAASINANLATKPMARWFGNWSGDIGAAVSTFVGNADGADKLPLLVAYNVPGRDCGGHSGGGAGSPDAYRAWISAFATAIGNRPAVVMIEPDALAQLDCLPNDAERATRTSLLRYATEQFKAKAPNTWAYMDAGNATWISPAVMAPRLEAAGVRNVRGFAVNVSNYHTTSASVTYSNEVVARLGYAAKFIIDTSRNGNGSNGEWCNPAGRKLGVVSQVGGGAEMLLWVKVPGDSDGSCGIGAGIPAGQFSPVLATRLINGT